MPIAENVDLDVLKYLLKKREFNCVLVIGNQKSTLEKKKKLFLKMLKETFHQRQIFQKENAKARTNSKQFYFLKDCTPLRVCQKFF